ncbi:hypothetical protein [Vitreimonas flagellata]|uniref:hypothetical protein n=1 Tax=Vitreimonas flagellata TaxID=2560861 RepID=UPI001075318F|nr:hypothetical protein [Vitreimonas flagellata]
MRMAVLALLVAFITFAPPARAIDKPTPLPSTADLMDPVACADREQVSGLVWIRRPHNGQFVEQYPHEALAEPIDGAVELACRVREDFGLSCAVSRETPQGRGFDQAALNLAGRFEVAPVLVSGASTEAMSICLRLNFPAELAAHVAPAQPRR